VTTVGISNISQLRTSTGRSEVLSISCDSCVMRATAACHDCVVTFVCDRDDGPLELDADEVQAVRLLAEAGLVPTLRHRAAG
jgi:hypothetical protein